jgi:hypothetical protein
MDIKGMQYDFKQKLNKIDSQQYRNLRIPEIDWKLNEGLEIFIKSIAEPRVKNHLGFERNQRTIDDIRTIVVNDACINSQVIDNKTYFVTLPQDYMFYLSAEVSIEKSGCGTRKAVAITRQHDDRFKDSVFNNSSFEWGEVNIRFYENGIKIFTDGTFTVSQLCLNYIKKHSYIHNAQDFLPTNSYNLPDGTVLTGVQNCELPEHTHREIVDIAVLITTGDLQIPDYQTKQAKINLNKTI